jgi:hypothetical protein
MSTNCELNYEVLQKKIKNPMHNGCHVIHKGTTNENNYNEFLEIVDSFLGFYFCTSQYYKNHCFSGNDDILIQTRTAPYYNLKEFRLLFRDMHDCMYYSYSMLPFVVIDYTDSNQINIYGKMQFKYLQKWPFLLLIYCLKQKANNNIFIFT